MFINSGVNNEIRMLIKVCDEIKNHYYDEDVEKVLTPILKSLLLLIEIKLIKASTNPIVLKIQRYIQQNISSKISLTDIARVISYSPSYCDIIFKNETGKSIINYSIDLKINEAKQLLIEGVYSLKKIADSLGFSDYNYFSRLFKKRTGYTPSEYALNNF
jgi:two-component system response regulator YesN